MLNIKKKKCVLLFESVFCFVNKKCESSDVREQSRVTDEKPTCDRIGRQTVKSIRVLDCYSVGVDTPRVENVVILKRRLLSEKRSIDREIRIGLLAFDRR